jgi:hypothetical protein
MLLHFFYYYDNENDLGFNFGIYKYIRLFDKYDIQFAIKRKIGNRSEYAKYIKDKDKYKRYKYLYVFSSELDISIRGISKKYSSLYYIFFTFNLEVGYDPGAGGLEEKENPDEYDKYNFEISLPFLKFL